MAMFSCTTATRAVATSGDYLEQGTNYYRQGDFLSASAALNWAIRQTPTNANAHYYLANVLVKLGRMSEAQNEYQRAFTLSQDPKIKTYCQAALIQFMQAGPGVGAGVGVSAASAPIASRGPVAVGSRPATVNMRMGTGATAASLAGNAMGSGMPGGMAIPVAPGGLNAPVGLATQGSIGANSSPRQLASQRIDEQANMTSLNLLKDGDAQVAQWKREGARRANSAQFDAERNAADMRSATYKKMQVYTPEQVEAQRQATVASGQDDQRQAEDSGARALQYARAKVWETQAAAANLQDQLAQPALPGSAKLKAEGTNLYVRTFDTPLIDPGPGDKAHAWKLNPTLPLTATPKSLGLSQRTKGGGTAEAAEKRKSSVFGQVLD